MPFPEESAFTSVCRRDSMNDYTSPAMSAHGTPGSYHGHTQFESPFLVPNQQMRPQSVGGPSDDAISLPGQHQMRPQFAGSPSSAQGPPRRPRTWTQAGMTTNGASLILNEYPHNQQEPLPFFVDDFGQQYTESQVKEKVRLHHQQQTSARLASMYPQDGQHYGQFQFQHTTLPPSQPPQSAVLAKSFAVSKNGRHFTREEFDKLKLELQVHGRAYFKLLKPEHKQRFPQLQQQEQYLEVRQHVMLQQQRHLQQQRLRPPTPQNYQHHQYQYPQHYQHEQPPQLAPRQQPTPPYASPALSTSNTVPPNMRGRNVPDEGVFDKNGKPWTKEQMHTLIGFQKQQHKERLVNAEVAPDRTQMQVLSPESSGDVPKASQIDGEHPGSVSASHMNKLSSQSAGRKRCFPDSVDAYKDSRSPKATIFSKGYDGQNRRNAAQRVFKPRTTASGAEKENTVGAGAVPVRKVTTTKQQQSQDVTAQKRPRGRPRKSSNTNDAPTAPNLLKSLSKAHAPDIIDLTESEDIWPFSSFPRPETVEAEKVPNKVDISDPTVHQRSLHSPHRGGVSMADLEVGSSIHDNMVDYLSELESHHRITVNSIASTPLSPLFTDNTMDTDHASALGLPTGFDMVPVINKVRCPDYDVCAAYQEPELSPHPSMHTDHAWTRPWEQTPPADLPDDLHMSEELALFEWGMQQQAKNRESAERWGADTYGESTWNYDLDQSGLEGTWNYDLDQGSFEGLA
ncbi:hypothetical protein G6011_03501 [Alternaria panax]|uniref:Uncharacterized protein n=1 Tax=Alternaria panax TaxID=48097 RepID=A0AAD4IEU9_9PLEO|nr:hypothetical protein G6011_03501 [Alternaria panax]